MSSQFEPAEIDASNLRRAMGRFATGIAVVTTRCGDEMHGMTANSITTVSFDPLLVLFCVSRASKMNGYVREAGKFAINILALEQDHLSRHFASSSREDDKKPYGLNFDELAGTAAVIGALATIACEVYQIIEAGDHSMVLGRVLALRYDEGENSPLLYYRGQYRHLQPPGAPERELPHFWLDSGMRVYYEEW